MSAKAAEKLGAAETRRLKEQRRAAVREAVLRLSAEGLDSVQIASRLRVSTGTVFNVRREAK